MTGTGAAASSTMTSPSTTPDVGVMSTAELRAHVDRCSRLMGRPQLLERLPDRGEGIRRRLGAFTAELRRREDSAKTAADEGPPPVAGHELSSVGPSDDTRSAQEKTYASNAAAIMERYKDRRVSVEETVRKMYGGSLSEREMQRIIADVPEKFFLTYAETLEREREMAKQARQEELAKLRQQTAARP